MQKNFFGVRFGMYSSVAFERAIAHLCTKNTHREVTKRCLLEDNRFPCHLGRLVCLVCLVYLAILVCLVGLICLVGLSIRLVGCIGLLVCLLVGRSDLSGWSVCWSIGLRVGRFVCWFVC